MINFILNAINRLKMDDTDYQIHALMYYAARRKTEIRLFEYFASIYQNGTPEFWSKKAKEMMKGLSNKQMLDIYLTNETNYECI